MSTLGQMLNILIVDQDANYSPKLKAFLENKFKGNKLVKVIHGNVLNEIKSLEFDRIVSNLPYSICEPLFHLLP